MTVNYDAVARSYTLATSTRSETFLVPNPEPARDPSQNSTWRSYDDAGNNLQLQRSLYWDSDHPYPIFHYSAYGFWTRPGEPGEYTSFVYGIPTDPATLPTSGTVSYTSTGFTVLADTVAIQRVLDFALVRVDFAAGTVSVHLVSLANYQPAADGVGPLDAAHGTFTVKVTGKNALTDYAGTVTGGFYGPGAPEIGFAFTVHNSVGGARIGGMAGKPN